jgi:HEAT repeat protein
MAPMNISGVRITTVEFNGLPLENIKEFQLQRRSYEWAKFKKVALRPNQKSDVQVEGKLNVTKLLTVLEQERFVHIRQGIILMVDEIGDKEPISFLSEQLKSKDRKRRCDAALALELLGDRRGVPAIIKELNDTSYRPTERIKSDGSEDQEGQVKQDHYYAALLLGILGDERAVPALIEATQEETIDYRAATSLGQIGDKRAIPALRDMLERCSDKPFPRLFAGYGLAMLGDKEGLKVVIDTLNTHQENWTIRRHAIEALGDLGNKEAVPYLITALKDEHPNIRVSAAVSLGVIGDNSALPALEQALKDKTETKINAPTTVSKAAEKASDQILKQSSKPDVQAEGQDAQMKARAEAAAEAIAQINNRDGTLGEGFLSKTPNQLLNAIPVLRLEKAKYVIGESIRFWVGVECLDDDVIIPEKYWNTCFLHITRPDGTIKKESVGWPIDGMLHTGWMGGWGFGKEDVQVGKYTLVFEFANKKTEPVELIVEELDVLRKIKATFDFQRAGNISKGEHIPIILTVQNNSKHVIQFPRRGVSDALVSIRVKRQEPSMESGFFYPIERLKGTLKNTYNWDRAASVPPIVLGPGERFEQKLWLEKAYELWGPGEYEVTFSTVLALFVGEKNGKFAAYCPIRLSIVTTENFRVITQGHGQEELAD